MNITGRPDRCAVSVMAKAPRPVEVKTRLLPPRRARLGDSLLDAAEDLLGAGYGAVCLVNADSPTLPTAALVEAARALAAPGDRLVLGPAADGGYYLIGLKRMRRRLFEDIAWSTERAFRQTIERAGESGLDTLTLPLWYDVDDVASLRALQRDQGADTPRVSLWLTGLNETIDQLEDFMRLAHDIDVADVYLQRLVYFREGQGLARPESALFPTGQVRGLKAHGGDDPEGRLTREAEDLADRLGIAFNASGASDPATSLKPGGEAQPWSLCRRPWTLMYVTAHDRVLPCCIAPFSVRGYDATLGDATQQTLRDIWNGDKYQAFRGALLSDRAPVGCAGCGPRWSL